MSYRPPFKKHVAMRLASAAGVPEERVEALLEVPPDQKLGELALPCFILAKEQKQPPPKIAAEIASKVAPDDMLEAITAAGPYVNFKLRAGALAGSVLPAVLAEGDRFGSAERGGTVVIDYSSPNIAKQLGIGHLRSTVIGNALARVLKHLGVKVIGINHLGDWGTQFGYMIAAWKKWGSEDALAADAVGHLMDLYVRANADKDLEQAARDEFKKLEQGDADAMALWKRFRELSLKEFHVFYDELGVSFDSEDGEAFFEDKMEPAVELLTSRGLTEMSEGALVVPMGEDKKPALLKKSDGATLYLTRDLAAALYRAQTYKPDRLLYVVGHPQQQHFQELFAILEMLDPEHKTRFVHVDFGHYRFKNEKMSTRSGKIVKLEDLFEKGTDLALEKIQEKNPELEDKNRVARQISIAAVLFNDLSTDRVKDLVFEWEKALDFDGDTAPYVMFAHVRARGILRKLAEEGVSATVYDLKPELLSHPHERGLLVRLGQLGDVLEQVGRTYKPHTLAQYLLELARVYHRFCHDCPVLKAEAGVREARLLLTRAVAGVLKLGMTLLGLPAPERM
jgi:arginyl-tRNA synthetase